MSRFGITALIIIVALVGTVVLASVIAAYQPPVRTVYVTTTQTSYVPIIQTTQTSYITTTQPTIKNMILNEVWTGDYPNMPWACGLRFQFDRTLARGPLHISYTVSGSDLPSIDFYLKKASPSHTEPIIYQVPTVASWFSGMHGGWEGCDNDIWYGHAVLFSKMDTSEFDGMVNVDEAGLYEIFLLVTPEYGKISLTVLIEQTLTTVTVTPTCTPIITFYVGYIKTARPIAPGYPNYFWITENNQIIDVSYNPRVEYWGGTIMSICLTNSKGQNFYYEDVTEYSLTPVTVLTGQICT